ncbi:MAG: hypothetical protein HC868_10180 [Sphingomonadales bacterium]|nr:hypothetical protein [Sphingomonadales bacterium]
MTAKTVDPITLTVIWNSLISIAEELGITLRHTAFSEGVREGDDFATALFDRNAVMIAQGNFSPGHLGSMPFVAKSALQYFPVETLKPGDSILVNDSFIGAGHFPDTYQIMPVFLDGAVIGFVACSAHQVDMGGAAPGSQKVHGVTEAFQEGLRILPVRFVREGKIDEDILRIVLGNVRMPDKVRGDLLAQHTANLTASVRLEKMFRDYGVETVERAYAAILDRSEAAMRAVLADVRPAPTASKTRWTTTVPAPRPSAWLSTSPSTEKARWSSISPARRMRYPPRSIPTSTIPALTRYSPSRPSATRSIRRRKAACGPSSSRCAKAPSSTRNSPHLRAGGRSCRSASSTPSTGRWPRPCRIAPWAPSRTGPTPTSAASTTALASRSSCTTCRWRATAASRARTALRA